MYIYIYIFLCHLCECALHTRRLSQLISMARTRTCTRALQTNRRKKAACSLLRNWN